MPFSSFKTQPLANLELPDFETGKVVESVEIDCATVIVISDSETRAHYLATASGGAVQWFQTSVATFELPDFETGKVVKIIIMRSTALQSHSVTLTVFICFEQQLND